MKKMKPRKKTRSKISLSSRKKIKRASSVSYNKTVLPNKLRILSEQVPGVESFSLGICIDAGSRQDHPGLDGIAHFMEHAVFLKTKKRTSKQIAYQFETLGAYTNAFTTKEMTCFYVRALKKHFKKTLDILSDVVLNPLFHEKEIERERSIIIEEIISYDDEPEELIFDVADEMLFGSNGLAHPIAGTVDSVKKISIDDLTKFHSHNYSPNNFLVSFAGNIPHEKLETEISRIIGSYKPSRKKSTLVVPEIVPVQRKVLTKPFQQSHILYFTKTSGVRDKERFPLAVINVILGDGMSSRLYQTLREKHGLSYSAYSSLNTMVDTGGLYIYSGTQQESREKAEDLIRKEIKKFLTGKINKTEIKRAKEQIKSSTIMALESMYTRMHVLAKSEFSLGKYEDIETIISEIDSIKEDDIIKTAEKYFCFDNWSSIVFDPEE